MKLAFLASLLLTCPVEPDPCGAGEPCESAEDCAPGLVCPPPSEPLLGVAGVCVAPCGVGCCAEPGWCDVVEGVGICVTDDGGLVCASERPGC